MASPSRSLWLVEIVCIAIFGFAFVAAPKSCEWGLSAYVWAGVTGMIALFGAALALETALPPWRRAAWGLGFALACATVWLAGLFIADVRITCRLF